MLQLHLDHGIGSGCPRLSRLWCLTQLNVVRLSQEHEKQYLEQTVNKDKPVTKRIHAILVYTLPTGHWIIITIHYLSQDYDNIV